MMPAGPSLVISCPHCRALASVRTSDSGNTFGATTWTDGWRDAPMMPQTPRLTRCAACRKIFWTEEAPQLGYTLFGEELPPERAHWSDAPQIQPLDEAGVAEALTDGLGATPDREMELRVLRWWRGNDRFRQPDLKCGYTTDPGAIENMERLIEMMRDGEEDLLLFRAEAQRELGYFDDALATLRGVCCSDWWPAKSQLLGLIEARSRNLEVLFKPELPDPAPET